MDNKRGHDDLTSVEKGEKMQFDESDFIEIGKILPGTNSRLHDDIISVNSADITLNSALGERVAKSGGRIEIAYSPKYQALRFKATDDPSAGYVVTKSGGGHTWRVGLPKQLKKLHPQRGRYQLVDGHDDLYAYVEPTWRNVPSNKNNEED